MNLEETVKSAVIKAKEILKKDKCHNTMIIGFKGNKGFVIPVPFWNNNKTKERIFRSLTNSLRNLKVEMFIHIFESWMVKKQENKELDINILPSEHLDRVNTLCVIGKTKTDVYGIVIPFIKLGKRIIFETEEVFDSDKGCFIEDNLLKGIFNEVKGDEWK